ncbi:MAG TPA: hypothetical protein VEK08_00155 [Planctomycetota bacterium]|nr:hypothetical protein [Planctomycetota bacterium]
MVRKLTTALMGLSLLALVGLTGCKNSSDSDVSYHDIGDVRVFDEPSRHVSRKSTSHNVDGVPAPQPIAKNSGKAVTSRITPTRAANRAHVNIGDMPLD